MKVKLFTHTDFDGIGCGIIGQLAFGKENIDVTYCNYEDVNKKVKDFYFSNEALSYDEMYITDISITDELAKDIELCFNGAVCLPKVILFDHHPTALYLNEYDWCNVFPTNSEGKTSGTSLFYHFLVNYKKLEGKPNIKDFVEAVRQYDTWEWKTKYNNEEPKQWNDLLYIMGREEFIAQMMYKLTKYDIFDFNSIEEMLLRIEEAKKTKYFEARQKDMVVKPFAKDYEHMYNVGFVFAEQYISELGNTLATNNTDLDFIIIITGAKTVSYRTIKDNIDLGKDIASIYGGGGHPKASGSQISEELRDEIISLIFK